jgi:hypothetical protein
VGVIIDNSPNRDEIASVIIDNTHNRDNIDMLSLITPTIGTGFATFAAQLCGKLPHGCLHLKSIRTVLVTGFRVSGICTEKISFFLENLMFVKKTLYLQRI